MGKAVKLPGVGRIGVGVFREKSGLGVGAIGASSFNTNLSAQVIRGGQYREVINERGLIERQLVPGTGYAVPAGEVMSQWSRFWANIRRSDLSIDLGSGLVTNVGVLAMANQPLWSVTNAPAGVLNFMKYHATGTGATAAAATDIKLQTASGNGGQTPVAGTQVLVSAANLQKSQSVATISYTGSEAVTEWGLLAYNSTLPATSALSDATGSPFTAGSGTSGTVTGTPLTASSTTVMGQQMSIFENTGNATPSWGLVTSNTTSVVNVPAWYKVSDGTAGANPANTNTYVIRPIMWDHKVFSAINVINGDSIQFTYTLTFTSGG